MANVVRVDLAPDFPDQWVDLLDPKFMSNRRFEELLAVLVKPDKTVEEAEAFFRSRIAAWHVLDADSGEPLGDPAAATTDLGGLPIGITKAIGEKINELFTASVPSASRKG